MRRPQARDLQHVVGPHRGTTLPCSAFLFRAHGTTEGSRMTCLSRIALAAVLAVSASTLALAKPGVGHGGGGGGHGGGGHGGGGPAMHGGGGHGGGHGGGPAMHMHGGGH